MNEEAHLIAELKSLLNKANSDQDLTLRNLDAAVSVSRRPGVIDYRTSAPCFSSSIKEVLGRIDGVEKEMDALHSQIDAASRTHKTLVKGETPSCRNMSEWFAQHGRPKQTAMLSYHPSTHKRIDNHNVSDDGQVYFSQTLKTVKPKYTQHTSVAEKSRVRKNLLTKSNYRPMVRGYLFRPKMQGKGKSFKFTEAERFSSKKSILDDLDL